MTAPLDLEAIKAEFLTQCGPCDFGMPTVCTCPKADYRPAMLALVREVELLKRIERVYGDRVADLELAETSGQIDRVGVEHWLERLQGGLRAVWSES